MIITLKLSSEKLREIHNLMLNCTNKQDMFEHLIDIGLNAFNALHMSNSFERPKYSYSILPLHERQQRKTYHFEHGKIALIEV